MKNPLLIKGIEKLVDLKMKAIDRIVDELIEPIADVGNPEKLIGKPYEQWTPEDLASLIKIYGQGEDTPLTRMIFNKEYERVKTLEAEEKI